MTFATPWMLLGLLVPVALVGWLIARRRQRRIALLVPVLQILAVTSVVLALTRPLLSVDVAAPSVAVAIRDTSTSMPEDADEALLAATSELAAERYALVTFDAEPRVAFDGQERPAWRSALAAPRTNAADDGASEGSDLAAALLRADALAGRDTPSRWVVLTDGWETRGAAEKTVARLARAGRQITFLAPQMTNAPAATITTVSSPPAVAPGAPQAFEATIVSRVSTDARLTVRNHSSGALLAQATLTLQPGWQQAPIELELADSGPQTLAFALELPDAAPQPGPQYASTWTLPPYRVAVIENDPQAPTLAALQDMLSPAATCIPLAPDEIAADPPALREADVLVLGNVPASDLGSAGEQALRAAVGDGTSLLVTGGRAAFAPGGYVEGPLAGVLPIQTQTVVEQRDPTVTLVIIIDTSGSMKGARFDLAKETARLAIDRLKPHDRIGIVEFYGAKRWAARIQSAANRVEITRALNRLSAGGGTVVLPAIEEAYYALLNVNTRLKHVLLLTDGGVETGPFERIVRRMAEHGITVSTVMVGPGQHSDFLSDLAQWGDGRYYSASNLFSLPEIILKQPARRPLTPFVTNPTPIRVARASADLLGGMAEDLPPIDGYVRARPRTTAQLLVATADEDPVLARWRWGRGYVAALTTDLGGPWGAPLWESQAGQTLLRNLMRELRGAAGAQPLQITPTVRGGRLELDVRYVGAKAPVPRAPLAVALRPNDAPERSLTIEPLADGWWNTLLDVNETGPLEIEAQVDDERGKAAVYIKPRRELAAPQPNLPGIEALNQIAAEFYEPLPAATPREWVELWPWLAFFALASVLVQLTIRRWPRQAGAAIAILLAVTLPPAGRAAAPAPAASPTPEPIVATSIAEQQSAVAAALAEAPQQAALHAELATWHELAGDVPAARTALEQAIARSDEDDPAAQWRLRLAQLEHALGDHEAARAALDEADGRVAALLAAQLGEPTAALQLLPASPEAAEWSLLHGVLLRRVGEHSGAMTAFRAAAVQASPPGLQRFALAYLVVTAEAAGQAKQVADDWPVAAIVRPRFQLLWDLGAYEAAFRLLGEVADVDQRATLTREAVALAIDAGELSTAAALLESALADEPDALDLRIALAELRYAQGRPDAVAEVLRAGIASAETTADLLALADAANERADKPLVDEILAQVPRTPDAQYAVARWQAEAAAERGAFDAARAALEAALELAKADPRRVREIADQFAEFGARQRAVALLRELFDEHADHRVGARLAWLLERDQEPDQAMAVWRRVWDETAAPAIRRRAADKLLELAAETGQLADLAIELEERLAADTITVRELDLLVELYTRLNDPISVSEILYLFAERSGDEQAGARRLAEAYIRMGALAQADRIVRELLADDPANTADYLQQLAVLAIERRRPREAQAWAERLAAALGDPQAAAEITAGVFTLLELHDRAAEQYPQALAATPERVELWLLWADAMRSAGRGPAAVERLLILLHTAKADDLFLVAVDALLNIDADRRALRVALRQLQLRIAQAPEQTYLYDAAADVLDSLGAREPINDLMEIAAVFAGPQRGPIVREMLDRARARDAVDALIDYGNILVMLNFAVPPQTFVDLGRTLLEKDRDTEAARAFSRAILLEPTTEVKQAVAAAYEEALRPRAAERIYRELATNEPRNVAIAFRHGATLEQLGEFEAAFERYADALILLLDQLPQTVDGEAAIGTATTTRARRIRRIAANVGELQQYLNPVVDSLLSTARTTGDQERLKSLVFSRLEAELAQAASAEVSAVAQAPRVANLTRIARFVGFCLNDLDYASRCDRSVLATFDADAELRQSVAAAWLEWGLPEQALAWLEPHDKDSALPMPLRRYQQLRDALQTPPATALHDLPAAQAAALLLLNERDRARELLATLVASRETLSAAELLELLPVSLALEDDAALERLALQLPLELAAERTASRQIEPLETAIRIAWGRLSDSGRRTLVQRIADLAGDPTQANVELAWMLLQLQAAVQPWDAMSRTLAERVAAQSAGAARRLGGLLLLAPGSEQAPLLEAAWAAADANQRLDVLFGVAAYYGNEPPATLVAQVERLLALSPELRLPRHEPYLALTRPSWQHNTLQGTLGHVIAAYLLEQQPDNLAVRAAAAEAFAHVDETARGAELAEEVLGTLHLAGQFDEDAWRMIQALVPVLSPSDRRELVQELELATRMATASIVEQMTLFALQHQAGRQQAATATLKAAFAQQPSERTVRRELIDYLADNLDWQGLVDALAPHRANAEVMQSWELSELADAYRHLGRLRDARDVIAQDSGALAAMRSLHLETALGEDERALLLFRRFLTTNRLERRFYVPTAPAETPLGGLRGYLAEKHTDDYRGRKLLFVDVAGTPGFAEEYAAWWRSAAPNRNDLPELARSRIAATLAHGKLAQLKSTVVQRFEADQAHLRDFYLLSALAETDEVTLSPVAIERVSGRLAVLELPEPLDRSLRAQLLAETNEEAAAAVWRLRLAEELGTPRRGLWVGRWQRWLEQLGTQSTASDQPAAGGLRRHFLEAAAIPPTERLRDGMEAMLLRAFAAHAPPAAADDHRQALADRFSRAIASRFYPRTIQGLARQALAEGDEAAFDQWFEELVRLTPMAYGDLVPLDALAYLPDNQKAEVAALVEQLSATLVSHVRRGQLHPEDGATSLALLGWWAHRNDDRSAARDALSHGSEIVDGSLTGLLWIRDLAQEVDPQRAQEINQSLADAGLLHAGAHGPN